MTATLTAERLTRDHRAAQRVISDHASRQVLELWGAVDPANVDAAWPTVSRALAQTISDAHAKSASTAAKYLTEHAATAGQALVDIARAPTLAVAQLDTALRVTGPVAVKRATGNGMTPADAFRAAAVQIVGAASRLVQDGGRSTVTGTVSHSPQIVGYRRVGGAGRSCFFCAMLISRGAVYKSADTAGAVGGRNYRAGHAYHDHCHCSAEPLYEHEDDPADVVAMRQAYDEHAAGTPSPIRAWRDAYDNRIAPKAPVETPIRARDLTAVDDDKLAELLGGATADADVDHVLAELDRRDAVAREAQRVDAEKQARASARAARQDAARAEMDAEYDRRLADGDDPEAAYADVYGTTVEKMRREQAIAALRAQGYKGRSFDELSRAAFRDHIEQAYFHAEAETRGRLLNGTKGVHDTRDDRKLFDGNEAYARANASEELLAYWRDHGRLTLEDMRASLLGGHARQGVTAWL